jgi:hypothetical protein
MRTHSQILDELGGFEAVAFKLRLPPTTVLSWHQRDSIPARRWMKLIELAEQKGVKLKAEDLLLWVNTTQNACKSNKVCAA